MTEISATESLKDLILHYEQKLAEQRLVSAELRETITALQGRLDAALAAWKKYCDGNTMSEGERELVAALYGGGAR